MISIREAMRIGINACIDKLGSEFVQRHRDSSTSAYGETDDGVFCFVGVDDNPSNSMPDGVLILDSESKFPYRVSCNVSLEDGAYHFLECVVPSKR